MSQPEKSSRDFARAILEKYENKLNYSAPECTIDELREGFLMSDPRLSIQEFTSGMRVLLENRYIRRLNDSRLELTAEGRAWLNESH